MSRQQRRDGWYWVKLREGLKWMAAHWEKDAWVFVDCEGTFLDSEAMVIGPRIPTPDESWQCVPKAPTPDMLERGVDMLDVTDNLIPTYQAMLWVAPKPEES